MEVKTEHSRKAGYSVKSCVSLNVLCSEWLRHCPRQGTELPALLLSASVAIYCLLGKALILENHNRAFSLLERHPRAQPQPKRLHCPERSKSSKPFAFIGQIKSKQGLSFLSFHSASAHSPPRLSRHPAGIKAGSRDGGAETQHRGELRALTHRARLCAHCCHPCLCQGSQGWRIQTPDIPAV